MTPTMASSSDTAPAPSGPALGADDGVTPHQPTALAKRTGVLTFAAVAVVVAAMLGSGLWRAAHRPTKFVAAQQDLSKALEKLPFSARLPQPVPDGARLVGVIVQEPDEKRGPSIYAIETTYTVVNDSQVSAGTSARFVRVWQTNDVYVRKAALDPLAQRPDPTPIGPDTWYRRTGQSEDRQQGVSYTTRFGDGITMSVSGPDEQLVLDTINALTKTR